MFGLEMGVGVILPLLLLSVNHFSRSAPGITLASGFVVVGVILNRLNVAVTGMLGGSGVLYIPAWTEILITLSIVATGILVYLWTMEHLPIVPRHGAVDAARAD
jgi:Ni/Fe-hydrogenase subunit HybB-like protein